MTPVNPNATGEACRLLQYLYRTAGNRIITGQHTQTVPMEERSHIHQLTGKYPKLLEFELLSYSPNIPYEDASPECLTEVAENRYTMDTALQWAKENDGIVCLCFHWFSPLGGRDKSFYARNTDFDPSRVLIAGSVEREAFFHDLDRIALQLQRFRAENIPVLWRPLHEAEGDWFWWGSKGPEVAKELYKLLFHYYVDEKHLDNLLWVWSAPAYNGYPGDEYVDVIGWDIYATEHTVTDYKTEYGILRANTGSSKVAALTEVGVVPDVHLLEQSRVPWAYYMTWSKEFCLTEDYTSNQALQELYRSPYAVTL